MKKRIYFVQVGVSGNSPCFLPYSVGCIAAYLKEKKEITDSYIIADIIGVREKISDILKRFEKPDFVAFSCFTWNIEYNKTLAKKLKEIYPDVKIIFGGHSVPHGGEFLEKYPFIDYIMHNEGEETSAMFFSALKNNTDLFLVPNLSFRCGNENITTEDYHPSDLSDYPSPYTSGVFDTFFKDFPNTEFHATLETNRGCPYSCAYCEWCFTKKVRPFKLEKIKSEIDWMAKNKIKYCYCADANFGILKRDIEIAEYIVEQNKKCGYPQVFKPCYAKESDETVFAAGYLLNKNQIDKGVTLSYQSLNEKTLENIGRKSFTLEYFEKLDMQYRKHSIPTYTELILGLPGETYESFCKGICDLLEYGQNNSMTVYDCQVYPNTEMGREDYQKKYAIKTAKIPLLGIHYDPEFCGISEYFDVITETATMPKADWVKANMFSVVFQVFHHLGLLKYFAIYLHNEKNISYFDFYNRLFDFIYNKNSGYIGKLFKELYDRKNDTETADWTYKRDIFGPVGWYFEEGAFLELVYHSDIFWQEIQDFLKTFEIEKELYDELLIYQKKLVRTVGIDEISFASKYNFYRYFAEDGKNEPLTKKQCRLHIVSNKKISDWQEYAKEIIWFGKRYSATLLINPREFIEYTEE